MGNKLGAKDLVTSNKPIPKAKFLEIFKKIDKDKSGTLDSDELSLFAHEALMVLGETHPDLEIEEICGPTPNYKTLSDYKNRTGILKNETSVCEYVGKMLVEVISPEQDKVTLIEFSNFDWNNMLTLIKSKRSTNIEAAWNSVNQGKWIIKLQQPKLYYQEHGENTSYEGILIAIKIGTHHFSLNGNLVRKDNGKLRKEYNELMNNFLTGGGLEHINSQGNLTNKFGTNATKVDHTFSCDQKSFLNRERMKLILTSPDFAEITLDFKNISHPNTIGMYYQYFEDYKLDINDADRLGFHGVQECTINVGKDLKSWEQYFNPESIHDLNGSCWEYSICTEKKSKDFLI